MFANKKNTVINDTINNNFFETTIVLSKYNTSIVQSTIKNAKVKKVHSNRKNKLPKNPGKIEPVNALKGITEIKNKKKLLEEKLLFL